MNTTAIYPNRIADKNKLEAKLRLPEFPSTARTHIFYTQNGTLISTGYTRIVYGDHGPYVEFNKDTVQFDSFTFKKKSTHAWYDEWYSNDDSNTMLYDQKKDVSMLSNPPAGEHSHKGTRKEGYADYKVDMIYIDPYKCKIGHTPFTIQPKKEVVPLKVLFAGEECTIEWQQYAEGGVAMQLWCEDGPMGKATVCLPDYPLKDNQVIIKDYAENSGMLKALVDAGVVRDTGDVAPSGHIVGNVCDLLVKPE